MSNNSDFLIVGAGIFGVSAAIELRRRGHSVTIINPDTIPHHLAASTDISKVVRMEYGTDAEYFKMAEYSIAKWKEWNDVLGEELYHEVGYILLCRESMDHSSQVYEKASFDQLIEQGYRPERLHHSDLANRFPVVNSETYCDGMFNPHAGWVESGLVVQRLVEYARSIGAHVIENQTAQSFDMKENRVQAVTTYEGNKFSAGQVVVCAGTSTPYLIPDLMPYMKATGHPVFWIKPSQPNLFAAPNFAVFTADISNTGWYGFPLHPKQGVVKVALHADGLTLHPNEDDRRVYDSDMNTLGTFLEQTFPDLVGAPVVYTRRCLYTDTLDGHFWIDHHPEIKGLAVASGGSGHGFKMGPILGEMIADMAEGNRHQYSERYLWRDLKPETEQLEEARFISK